MTKATTEAVNSYRCIECGHACTELYHSYCDGVVKMMHCTKCHNVVDKYIEYDNVITCLDALLHKSQAYRHLLFNVHILSPWKLALIYLLCDMYVKWQDIEPHRRQHAQDYIFFAALEWDIYQIFTVVLAGWLLLVGCVMLLMRLSGLLSWQPDDASSSWHHMSSWHVVHRTLVVSSFGKLLAIAAVIWAETHSAIYLLFTQLLVLSSNIAAFRVLPGMNVVRASVMMFIAHSVHHIFVNYTLLRLYTAE